MRKKELVMAEILVPFLFLLFFPCGSFAENRDISLRFWGQISPFISGEAGSGLGAPDYSDAFGTGMGVGLELSRRFSGGFSLLGGVGYEQYDGKTYQSISFDDLKIVPLYVGGKFHVLPEESRWNPSVKMGIGGAHLSSVDISFATLEGKYWDSSWVFLFEFGGGLEYRFKEWGIGLEVSARYLGKPDSALGRPSDAKGSWSVPIRLGFAYHF